MSGKTLCNLSDRLVAQCDGCGWGYDEQKKYCDGATMKHTKSDACIHLWGTRCDSWVAQDIAVEIQKRS